MTLIISLPGPPRGKQRPRVVRATGRVYTPAETVAYEKRLTASARAVLHGRPLLEGPLECDMVALLPIAKSWSKRRKHEARLGFARPTKKPDWDNIGKMIDALNLVVWADDAQIVDGRVQKFYSDTPMLLLRIAPAATTEMPAWALPYANEDILI